MILFINMPSPEHKERVIPSKVRVLPPDPNQVAEAQRILINFGIPKGSKETADIKKEA